MKTQKKNNDKKKMSTHWRFPNEMNLGFLRQVPHSCQNNIDVKFQTSWAIDAIFWVSGAFPSNEWDALSKGAHGVQETLPLFETHFFLENRVTCF
jgi:hypothetical protein